jgi:hypothetical protein
MKDLSGLAMRESLDSISTRRLGITADAAGPRESLTNALFTVDDDVVRVAHQVPETLGL